MKSIKGIPLIGLFIWFISILFYFFEFFLGVFLGTIAKELMQSLNVNAQRFSLIGSAYYFIYSLMQLPMGIIVDRMGARFTLSCAAFICTLGTFWLSFTHSFFPAIISRSLMGLGASFAFVSILMLTLNWFPQKHFAFMAGITQFLGAIGPLLAGAPLAYLLTYLNGNWRIILFGIALFGGILTLLIITFIRNKPKKEIKKIIHLKSSDQSLIDDIKNLLKLPQVWGIILFAGFMYTSLPLLGAFWGTSFLQSKGLDKQIAASITSMLWLGLAIGCPLMGRISDYAKQRKPALLLCALIGLLSSFSLFSIPLLKQPLILALIFFLIGFAGSAQSITFALIAEASPRKYHATALGLNNAFIVLLSALIPLFISSIIQGSATFQNNTFIYTQKSFTKGLGFVPIFYFFSFIFGLFVIKETFCRQQHEIHKIKIQKD